MKFQNHLRMVVTASLSLIAVAVIATAAMQAQTFTVTHNFTGGVDGAVPFDGLTTDIAGNLYGTTFYGGSGPGIVFRLGRSGSSWILTPLYNLTPNEDGTNPQGWIDIARDGTLYGNNLTGGDQGCLGSGCGAVFHLAPSAAVPKSTLDSWTQTVIYLFNGGSDGSTPQGDVIFDQAGSIYGTAIEGGSNNCGSIYELTPSGGGWTETTIYSAQGSDFCNVSIPSGGSPSRNVLKSPQGNGDGSSPYGGVVFDRSGNLYGVFELDGQYGGGAVYELSPSGSGWTERILHGFTGGNDGKTPIGGLSIDSAGNLYGTTSANGSGECGTIFEIKPANVSPIFNTIYSFPGAPGGCNPQVKLTIDTAGNLYGTTGYNGPGGGGAYGFGLVFKLTKTNGGWVYSLIHDFSDGSDGGYPSTNLIVDGSGNLYGTSAGGGAFGNGVAWEITP